MQVDRGWERGEEETESPGVKAVKRVVARYVTGHCRLRQVRGAKFKKKLFRLTPSFV